MPTSPYPLVPQPMEKSWLERHPRWKIPLGVLTLLFLMALFGAGVISIVMFSFHHSDVYQQSVAKALANPEVHEQFGEPLRIGWFVSGELHVNGSTGAADLGIPISGPRGTGTIRAVASRNSGVWQFSYLQVIPAGKPCCINLLPAN